MARPAPSPSRPRRPGERRRPPRRRTLVPGEPGHRGPRGRRHPIHPAQPEQLRPHRQREVPPPRCLTNSTSRTSASSAPPASNPVPAWWPSPARPVPARPCCSVPSVCCAATPPVPIGGPHGDEARAEGRFTIGRHRDRGGPTSGRRQVARLPRRRDGARQGPRRTPRHAGRDRGAARARRPRPGVLDSPPRRRTARRSRTLGRRRLPVGMGRLAASAPIARPSAAIRRAWPGFDLLRHQSAEIEAANLARGRRGPDGALAGSATPANSPRRWRRPGAARRRGWRHRRRPHGTRVHRIRRPGRSRPGDDGRATAGVAGRSRRTGAGTSDDGRGDRSRPGGTGPAEERAAVVAALNAAFGATVDEVIAYGKRPASGRRRFSSRSHAPTHRCRPRCRRDAAQAAGAALAVARRTLPASTSPTGHSST